MATTVAVLLAICEGDQQLGPLQVVPVLGGEPDGDRLVIAQQLLFARLVPLALVPAGGDGVPKGAQLGGVGRQLGAAGKTRCELVRGSAVTRCWAALIVARIDTSTAASRYPGR